MVIRPAYIAFRIRTTVVLQRCKVGAIVFFFFFFLFFLEIYIYRRSACMCSIMQQAFQILTQDFSSAWDRRVSPPVYVATQILPR